LYVRSSQAIINSIRNSTFFGTCASVFDISGFGHTHLDTCNIVVSGKVFDLYTGSTGPQSNYILTNCKFEFWPQGGPIGTTQLIVWNSDHQAYFEFNGGGLAGGSPDPAVRQIVARPTTGKVQFNGGSWSRDIKIEVYDSVSTNVFGGNPFSNSFIRFSRCQTSPLPSNVSYNLGGTANSFPGVIWQDCMDTPNLAMTGIANGQQYNSSIPGEAAINKNTFTGGVSNGSILNGSTATTFPVPQYGQPAFLRVVQVLFYSSGVFVNGNIRVYSDAAKTNLLITQAIPGGAITVPILYNLTIPANTVITEGVYVEISNTNGIFAYGRVYVETMSI
jgi:hypothetical protein